MRLMVLALVSFAAVSAQTHEDLIRAMRDELQRARGLSIAGAEKPYFVQYVIGDLDEFKLHASHGGLVARDRWKSRDAEITMRVGDYKFDNTNFVESGSATGYGQPGSPREDLYPALRRYLWLFTDYVYKGAAQTLAMKRAAIKNVSRAEEMDDFAHEKPFRRLAPPHTLAFDQNDWNRRITALSGVPLHYPEVEFSHTVMYAMAGVRTLVNTEASEIREPLRYCVVRLWAETRANDGAVLRDAVSFFAPEPAHLASEIDMRGAVSRMLDEAVAVARAPRGEDYSGPVLFEGLAGRQILAELLAHNLAAVRAPVGAEKRNWLSFNELEGRIGARVLPEFMSVVDDPALTAWRGRRLIGAYVSDLEGVEAQRVQLIEKGILKDYLRTRQPVRGFTTSNGHARIPGDFGARAAAPSNLIVTASQTATRAELKRRLLALCQARGKAYGIIVRRMDFPSAVRGENAQALFMQSFAGNAYPVSPPVLVYKAFRDGREELVRGLRFQGMNLKSLKDIVAAGDDSGVLDFEYRNAPFLMVDGNEPCVPACVIAPSILVDDLDLRPARGDHPNPPVVLSPLAQR